MLGTTFGPYTIESLLGRGGMGEVYRAFDTETDREVALKVLPTHLAGDDEYLERFRRECRAAARLREPHIVPIHRFGEIDGRLYLDMRLVEGTDLGSWIAQQGPLTPQAAVAVVAQIARALDAAHAAGMVHRDVKPSNILLAGVDGEQPGAEIDPGTVFAYLFDFGIASSVTVGGAAGTGHLTRTGTVPGSLAYLAPERFRGLPADRRVDVYALACVLYQALTGEQPFSGDLPAMMHAHLSAPPPRPSSRRANVPTALDQVVERGMAKDPDERYPTAGALAAAARAAVGSVGSLPTIPAAGAGEPRVSSFGQEGLTTADPRSVAHTVVGPGWGTQGAPGRTSDPEHPVGPTGPGPAGAWGAHPSAPDHPADLPPYPSAPPTRHRSRGLVVALVVVAAVVVLVGGGAAAVLLTRHPGGSAPPATTPSQTAGSMPQTLSSVAPSGPPGPEVDALRALLPGPFSTATCTPNAGVAQSIGALAYLVCENGPADGPDSANFSNYASQSALDGAFTSAAQTENVPVTDGAPTGCRDRGSQATTYNRGTQYAGRVGCYIDAKTGAAFLFWTDNGALAFGYLRRSDGNAAKLYDWWTANGFTVER